MAHEITATDNMFSVIERPWHGLGEILDAPPTIEEAIKVANLGWEVQPQPLFTAEGMEAPAQGIVRQDTKEILGVVGTRYTPLQNVEAFSVFQPLLETGDLALETAGSLRGGRRVWILARILTSDPVDIGGKGDEVKPYILLSNAHDGKQAVRMGFTPVRVVCNNTLSQAHSSKSSELIRVAHLSNVLDSTLELTNMMDLQKAQFEATVEQYKALAAVNVSATDLHRYVRLSLASSKVKTDEDGVELEIQEKDLGSAERKVVQLFEEGRSAKRTGANLWRAYNAVNEFVAYERGAKHSQDDRLHSLWFAEGKRIDERALNIALSMAKAA